MSYDIIDLLTEWTVVAQTNAQGIMTLNAALSEMRSQDKFR